MQYNRPWAVFRRDMDSKAPALAYLKEYPLMLTCDGDFSTGGYAPGFVEGWLKSRKKEGAIEVYAGFDALIEDRTAIYISHRLSSCRFCDTITVFDAGQMVQSGTHEALVEAADGKYAQMWQAQAQYYV